MLTQEQKNEIHRKNGKLVICFLCKYEAGSLISHVNKVHNITGREYVKKYNQPLFIVTAESRKKISETIKKWYTNPENYKSYKSKTRSIYQINFWIEKKGKTKDEAIKIVHDLQSARSKKQKTGPGSKPHSIGQNNPQSLTSLAKKHNVSLLEAKKFTVGYGRTKEKHPMYGKHHSEEAKLKISFSMKKLLEDPDKLKQFSQNFINGAKEVHAQYELFETIKTKYNDTLSEPQILVESNVYYPDILLTERKIIIEFFGDYWHANPIKYDSTHIFNRGNYNVTAAETWEHDKNRIKNLEKAGYTVIIFWEYDYNNNREKTLEKIYDEIDKKNM